MTTILALIGALALAAIPIAIGWRRTVNEAGMARAMGVAPPKRRFDPQRIAAQSGTGLTFNQLAFGFTVWVLGGLAIGIPMGLLTAIAFAIAAGLIYLGGLSNRRQEFRLRQAKDILRALGVVQTLLEQGRTLTDAMEDAARAAGPDGQMVLNDLVVRLRAAPADQTAEVVREWTTAWDNPGVDMLATALLASIEGRIEIGPLMASLRRTLNAIVEVLSRARAAAKGIEWQARFLAIYPPLVLLFMAVTTPRIGEAFNRNPLLVLPVLLGSGISFLLSDRMIRNGLSIETSMGLQAGRQGEIRLDRMGRVL